MTTNGKSIAIAKPVSIRELQDINNFSLEQLALKNNDPLHIHGRLYRQIAELLTALETDVVDIKVRVAALAAIGRLQGIFVTGDAGDTGQRGSAVRRYATAFAKNASRGRKAPARPTLDDDDDHDSAF